MTSREVRPCDAANTPAGDPILPELSDEVRRGTEWRSSFLRGLIEPSLGALLVAAFVGLASFAVLFALGTPERLLAAQPYFAEGGWDRPPFVTADVLHARAQPADEPTVFVLGASGMHAAVGPDEMTALLRAASGDDDLRPLYLTAWGATTWEMLAVLDGLGPALRGVVVLGVSPSLLSRDEGDLATLLETPRFGFLSTAVDAEAMRLSLPMPARLGVHLWDVRGYYLSRVHIARARLLRGPASRDSNRNYTGVTMPADDPRWAATVAGFDAHSEYHAELIARTVRRLQGRSVRVLLVEAPWNPAAAGDPQLEQLHRRHVALMERVSSSAGVPYVRLDVEAGLRPEEFLDVTHVGSAEAWSRFTRALAAHVTPELALCE